MVKSVHTRFGQPLTTGNAFVYSHREDMEKEPKYILERHAQLSESAPSDAGESAEDEPAPASEEDVEIAGGEE